MSEKITSVEEALSITKLQSFLPAVNLQFLYILGSGAILDVVAKVIIIIFVY